MKKLAIDGGSPVRVEPFPDRRFGDEEIVELTDVVRSGILGRGPKVHEFERAFADLHGVKHCVASTSGTAAIHIAVGVVDPLPGDEIISAPITDMGGVITVIAQNAIPVFADVDANTGNIDPKDVERKITDRTKAIIPVHLAGNPCDMDPIMEIAAKHNLIVIEDCSQAHLAEYKGRRVGTIGHIGAFSLQQGKHMRTGEGGMTITNDDKMGERARLFGDKGWPRYSADGAREHLVYGMTYRMTNLQAAVGLAQLRKLQWVVQQRIRLADMLTELISDIDGLIPPIILENAVHTYWFYHILVKEETLGISPGRFAELLRAEGIPAKANYIGKPIFLYEMVRRKKIHGDSVCPFGCPLYGGPNPVKYEEGACPNTERFLDEMTILPLNEFFTEEDIRDIATAVQKVTYMSR
jgi:dTDP-4-amino-4,6-dideoxygalactose transaminase